MRIPIEVISAAIHERAEAITEKISEVLEKEEVEYAAETDYFHFVDHNVSSQEWQGDPEPRAWL